MNINYSRSSLKDLLPGRRFLLLLSLVFLTANVFGQARNYQFAQSSAAYTEIAGGTVSTATGDDGTQVIPMPFPFTYAGTVVTDITMGTNGFVRMAGGAIFGSNWTNILTSTASLPVLAPFWDDHHLLAASGTIVYATTGTAPNRQLSIEFRDLITSGTGSTTSTTRGRFKVSLFETSNQIVYHYGTSSATTTLSGSIGMNSAPGGVGQFLSVTPGVNATASTSVENNAIVTLPDSGVVYTFTPSPATCNMPWFITSSNVLQTGFTINWRNTGSTSYQYAVTNSATLPTGAGTSVTDTFAAVTGLVQNTAYYVYVRSVCTGGTNSAWAGPVLVNTGGPVTSVASGLWSNPLTWSTGAVPNAASSVTISANDSVFLDVATAFAASLDVNGVLGVNAAAQRILNVAGNVNIAASGSLSFAVPTTGTSLRIIELAGNFTHAGNSNMANANAAIRYIGTTPQTFTNTGALLNNAVGQLIISNPAGVTLASPVTVGFNLDLVAGVLTAGSNLTFDHVAVTGTSSQVRRSPLGSLVGTPIITSTVHNVQYVFFTGQTSALITEGPEMPASRTINALTINNPAGLNLTGDLTVTAATSALVLTNGIINLPANGKIISTNTAFAPTVGSNTAFINGGLQVTASTTANTTRNFPVGSVVDGIPTRAQVVIANIITGGTARQITVMPVGAPSGTGVAPVTAVMGPRAFQITATGSLGTGTTVALNWQSGDANQFFSSLPNIRIAQASALGGPWTARSATATTGSLTGAGTRTSTAVSLANGEFFGWSTVGAAELGVVGLAGPNMQAPCLTSNEVVRVVLRNTGGATMDYSTSTLTVNASVTTPSGTVINLAPVVKTSGTVAPNANDTVAFITTVDMVAQGRYALFISIDSLAGQVRTNDTLRTNVRSHQINAVATPPITIVSLSANLAVRSSERMRITEYTQFFGGAGQTPAYPPFVTSNTADPDLLEMTNLGSLPADLSGHRLEVLGVGARIYTFPQGTIVPPFAVVVVHIGTGVDQPQNNFYNTGGANGTISSTSLTGYVLRDTSGAVIDAVAANGFAFPATSGVSIADWSGAIGTGSAGASLIAPDGNFAASWRVATALLPQSIGSLNPGLVPDTAVVSWTGPGGFTANGASVSTGVRNAAGVETYNASIAYGTCVRTATADLEVLFPSIPIAGFTTSSDTATTGGLVSVVTFTDTSLNLPTQRRWSFTPNAVTFVNGTNDSSVAPQVTFNEIGIYSVNLVVSNIAGADTATRLNAIVVNLEYCTSSASNTGDTKIDSVVINGLAFGSASVTCESYTNNTAFGVAATIDRGTAFPLAVRSGYCGTSGFSARGRVFIDWNQDGIFTANEAAADFGPLTATGQASPREWFNMNIVVPTSADTGVTRLRVVYREGASVPTDVLSCGTYAWGETEDYSIRIKQADLTSVVLLAPSNQTFVRVAGEASNLIEARWTRAEAALAGPISYSFELATSSTGFTQPIYSRLSDQNGTDTSATFTYQQLEQILINAGIQLGQTFNGFWNVKATSGAFVSNALMPFSISLQRGVVGPTLPLYAPPSNGGTTQVRAPNGLNTSKNMQAAMIVPAQEFMTAGLVPGDNLLDVRFTVNNGTDVPVRGFMQFWILPTNDNTYLKGNLWPAIPGNMMQVFADSVTLPQGNGPGSLRLNFPVPIQYNGQSMYVAYKFSSSSALATIPVTYRANTLLQAGLVSSSGNLAAPDTMQFTSFRPELGWGKERLLNDLELRALYTYHKNLPGNGTEQAIIAVRNNGVVQDPAATFNVSVSGANPSNTTYSLPALNLDETYYFALPVLSTSNSGVDQVSVSLTNDQNTSNNQVNRVREVAQGAQSLNGATQSLGNWGFNLGAGVFYTRYQLGTTQTLLGANVLLGNDQNTIGRELFVQVIDSAGNLLGSSVASIVGTGEIGQRKQFSFAQPIVLNAGSYFIGLAQPASTNGIGYYPVGVVTDPLPRPATYYFSPIGGGTPPTLNSNLYSAGLAMAMDATFAFTLPPIAAFSQSDYVAVMGGQQTTVSLTDQSGNSPNAWNWQITHNDPNVSAASAINVVSGSLTGPQLELSFNVPGIYSVQLVVSNNIGADSVARLSTIFVAEELCVSSATNFGDTKIDAVQFATISTQSPPMVCERYTSYVGFNPIIGANPQRGEGILRMTYPNSKSLYVFAGNMSANGWGASYDQVQLRSANAVLAVSSLGDNFSCEPPANAMDLNGKIAVVYRGSCEFGAKAFRAQQAGAIGVIIINNVPGLPINLGGGNFGSQVNIPVAIITDVDGAALVNAISQNPFGTTIEMGGAGRQVGQLFLGQRAPIAIKPGSCSGTFYPAYGKVYIDYNGDLNFDTTEVAFSFQGDNAFNWQTGIVNVPLQATTGLRRMRVVYQETGNLANVNACGTYAWGETEDYLVEISNTFFGVQIELPDVISCVGPVSIPVTATNFNDVGALSMSILYDPTALNFVSVSGINPALAGGTVLSNALNGRLGLSWFDINGTTAANDTLFYLDFIVNNNSILAWDQTPGSNEIASTIGLVKALYSVDGSMATTTACNDLVGVLHYGNSAATPLSNSEVVLFRQGVFVKSVLTDAAGNFAFTELENDFYTLAPFTNKPWGGVNATDALGVARHFTGSALLSGIRLAAADVNGNASVNATDALQIARRFTGQISSFVVGDWAFEFPVVQTNASVTVQNITGLTYGDVNASHSPAQNRLKPLITLDSKEVVYAGDELVLVPVHIDRNLQAGALSLELNIPQGVEVLGVQSALGVGEFQYEVLNGVLRIAWFSLSEVSLLANDKLFDLQLRTLNGTVGTWSVEGLSEMANGWAEAYPEVGLRLPRVVRSEAGIFAASVYPNPATDAAYLQVQMPTEGMLSIRITDALGKLVFEQTAVKREAGAQIIALDATTWAAGAYHASVLYENGEKVEQKHLNIQKIK